MTDFLESPRFPETISYGSAGGPGFKTFVWTGHSGVESRTRAWSRSRGAWNAIQGVKDKADMDDLREFFYGVAGKAIGFRFKDWGDFDLVAEQIGVGDNVQLAFPITKTYTVGSGGGALTYIRRIFKPCTSPALVVTVNSVIKTVTTDYAVDYTTGVVTFVGGMGFIPGVGHTVKVTGEFDVPCRFDTDHMESTHDGYLTESWAAIPIVELLLED